jgi:hypothetical protein
LANIICGRCKREWQARSGLEPCPFCSGDIMRHALKSIESHERFVTAPDRPDTSVVYRIASEALRRTVTNNGGSVT